MEGKRKRDSSSGSEAAKKKGREDEKGEDVTKPKPQRRRKEAQEKADDAQVELNASQAKLEEAQKELKAAQQLWEAAVVVGNTEVRKTAVEDARTAVEDARMAVEDARKLRAFWLNSLWAAEEEPADKRRRTSSPSDEDVQRFVEHLCTIDESSLRDESHGMEFLGRRNFFEGDICKFIRYLMASRPDSKSATALVYSSVSGSGKTVSMLRLKKELPSLLSDVNVVVAYLGFGCALQLHKEERNHIRCHLEDGVLEVLARRLMGSIINSNKNKDVITKLCNYDDAYQGRVFPTVEQCKAQLIEKLGASLSKPVVIVAGVDEVQLLDTMAIPGLSVGLGRMFLRVLRGWQEKWWDDGLFIVPLGTGIALDFPTDVTTGINRRLVGEDAVLISRTDFKEVVRRAVKRVGPEELAKRVGHCVNTEDLIAQMSAVMWPRVRLVEWWRDGRALERHSDGNLLRWDEWLLLWLRDKVVDCEDVDLLPGKGTVDGKVYALFQLGENSTVQVIPDGHQGSSIVTALEKKQKVPFLYNNLDVVKSLDPSNFFCREAHAFEDLAFHVVGAALHLGMVALADDAISSLTATETQMKRLGLSLWLRGLGVSASEPPVVEGVGIGPLGDSFPFDRLGSEKNAFGHRMQKTLREALGGGKPVFIRGGRAAPNDYTYLYPRGGPTGTEYVAILVDAKHTVSPKARGIGVTTRDQIELYTALVKFSEACASMSFPLAGNAIKLLFLTNRDRIETPRTGMGTKDELDKARGEAQGHFSGCKLEMELLTSDKLEFEPFSTILFARLPAST